MNQVGEKHGLEGRGRVSWPSRKFRSRCGLGCQFISVVPGS